MSVRTDGGLALGVLVVFLVLFWIVETTLSWPFFLLGVLGTVGFELISLRYHQVIRTHWERPTVQRLAVLLALAGGGGGAIVAPAESLSAGIGALLAYLVGLGIIVSKRRHSSTR